MPYEGPGGDDQLRPSKSKKKKESKGIVADFFGNLAETAAVPFQAAGRLVKGIYEYGKTEEEEEETEKEGKEKDQEAKQDKE